MSFEDAIGRSSSSARAAGRAADRERDRPAAPDRCNDHGVDEERPRPVAERWRSARPPKHRSGEPERERVET
jgi:hypothetical protein